MNKYIRTKDGIYEVNENGETYNGFGCKTSKGTIKIHKKDIIKQADTIGELIVKGDLLVVGNNESEMPILVESIEYLKSWLYCHDIYKIKEFYIKCGNNYRLVAKRGKERVELI